MNRSREEKVAIIMANHIADKYNCKCKPIKMNGDGYLYLYNKKFDLSFKAQYSILSVAGWGCKPKPIGLITFRF